MKVFTSSILWIVLLALIIALLGNVDLSHPYDPVHRLLSRNLVHTNAKDISLHALGITLRCVLRFVNSFRIPSYSGKEKINGIKSSVRVVTDKYGVPHIFGNNDSDLFYTQGYIHGRERLFQLTTSVLAANGRLSEFLGPDTIEADRLLRVMGFNRLGEKDAQRCDAILKHYPNGEKDIRYKTIDLKDPYLKPTIDNILLKQENQNPDQNQVENEIVSYVKKEHYACKMMENYVQGINQFVFQAQEGGWLRYQPLEMLILGIKPFSFTPSDFYAFQRFLAWQMNFGWEGEITTSIMEGIVGKKALQEWKLDETWDAETEQGIGHPILPKGIEKKIFGGNGAKAKKIIDDVVPKPSGSNWMIASGNLTKSGNPIVGNDPHLPLTTPSFWFANHLSNDDDINAIGYSVPGIAGIVVGRSQYLSSGVTLSLVDTADVFLEKVKKGNFYQFKGEWIKMKNIKERIKVKSNDSQKSDIIENVKITKHGPVISQVFNMDLNSYSLVNQDAQISQTIEHNNNNNSNNTKNKNSEQFQYLLSQSNIAFQENVPGTFFFSVNSLRLQSVSEAEQLFAYLVFPALSLGFADNQGNIGFRSAGKVPVRNPQNGGDGERVRPGWSGNYDWNDFIHPDEMPHAINPDQGYLTSCNNNPMNPFNTTQEEKDRFGRIYVSARRCFRADEMMKPFQQSSTGRQLTLEDMQEIHSDVYSHAAEQTVRLVVKTLSNDDKENDSDIQLGLKIFKNWIEESEKLSQINNEELNDNNQYKKELFSSSSKRKGRFRIDRDSISATVYEQFKMTALRQLMVRGFYGDEKLASFLLGGTPFLLKELHPKMISIRGDALPHILSNPNSYWVQKFGSAETVMKSSLKASIQYLRKHLGNDYSTWRWGRLHRARCGNALSVVPVLHDVFATEIEIDGDETTVAQAGWLLKPQEGNGFYQSLKTVHEMSETATSTFVLPPGNSGNLGSIFYENGSEIIAKREQVPFVLGNEYLLNQTFPLNNFVLQVDPQ